MMDRAFDHQRILHGVAEERAPCHVAAHRRGVAAGDRRHLAEPARAHDPAERRLVLVEAVAHGDRHLAAGLPDLPGDAQRPGHGVGDRLLAQDVEAAGERRVDHRLVAVGRHDDRAEVGRRARQRPPRRRCGRPRPAGRGGSGRRRAPSRRRRRCATTSIVLSAMLAARNSLQPAPAERADPDMDHPLRHFGQPLIPRQPRPAGRHSARRAESRAAPAVSTARRHS